MDLRSDDLREALTALRDLLADRIIEAKPGETAPLARQLAEVLARLESLPGEEKSDFDELRQRRAQRRAALSDGAVGEVDGSG